MSLENQRGGALFDRPALAGIAAVSMNNMMSSPNQRQRCHLSFRPCLASPGGE